MSGGLGKLLANAGAMLRVGLLQRAVGLVLVTVLSRILEPKGLGTFTFVQSTSNTFAGLSRLGVDAGLHVELASLKPDEKQKAEAVLGEALTLTLLAAGVMAAFMAVFASPVAVNLFAAPELAPFVAVSAALLMAQMLAQYCYVAFAGLHAFPHYSRITTAATLASAVLALAGSLIQGAWGCVIGFTAGQVATLFLLVAGLRRELLQRELALKPRWPGREARALLTFGLPYYLSTAVILPVEFACLGLLSRSAGLDALGELRVTQSLMSLAAIIPAAIAGPMTSHLAAAETDEKHVTPVLAQLKFNWLLALLIVTCCGVIWAPAVDIAFGANYPAASSLGALALAAFLPNMLVSVMTAAVLVRRRSLVLLMVGFCQASSLYVSAWLLIPRFGLGGLLGAQALAAVVAALMLGATLARMYGQNFLRRWMVAYALLSACAAAVIAAAISNASSTTRATAAVAAVIATLATAWRTLSAGERAQLVQLIATLPTLVKPLTITDRR